ncbi:hypothetical protein [Prosthecobacter dejongeii]|uniref:O-antigen/teichoic acid export membrane protein n=1 Tax=Prosthecobacter dejongeii TaxID=48465 RepID=A0A7W7YM92_9BACT|nr:hypothetical protein [Prosthecobacter dejongeii]MBB5038724.1 O-antigen/teichoic acid export membrane protein [Prosthecobacter dejongeii]
MTIDILLCIILPISLLIGFRTGKESAAKNASSIAIGVITFLAFSLFAGKDSGIDGSIVFGAVFVALIVGGLGVVVREKWDDRKGKTSSAKDDK